MHPEGMTDKPCHYPGRGLVVGRCGDGTPFGAYYVTGRSAASQSRTVVRLPNGDVSVVPTGGDTKDPLRHYVAVTVANGRYVLGNGDHVEEISRATRATVDVYAEFRHQVYEPDPPIRTRRIIAAVEPDSDYWAAGSARHGLYTECEHLWFETNGVPAGKAIALKTYQGDIDVLLADGEPSWTKVEDTLEGTLGRIWTQLNSDLRVLALVVDLRSGEVRAADRLSPDRFRSLEA
jgi:hypothetical protein